MTYKQHIYHIINSTDLENKKDVTDTLEYLAAELMQYQDLALAQEDKLKDLMPEKEFMEWSKEEAKKMFRKKVENCKDEHFKKIVLEHFDEITGGNNA